MSKIKSTIHYSLLVLLLASPALGQKTRIASPTVNPPYAIAFPQLSIQSGGGQTGNNTEWVSRAPGAMVIGTGNSFLFTFSNTLTTAVSQNSLTITAGAVTGKDDGAGHITGKGITGTVVYATGAVSVTFTNAVPNLVNVTAAWSQLITWIDSFGVLHFAGGSGPGITSINTLIASNQFMVTGTAGTDFGIVSSVATHTFNLPDASATARGVVNTDGQTFNGNKTFLDDLVAHSLTLTSSDSSWSFAEMDCSTVSPTSAVSILCADQTAHQMQLSNNAGAFAAVLVPTGTPVDTDCAKFSVAAGKVQLADTGFPCGSGAGSVTLVSGTANQIDVATGSTTPVVSIDAALVLPGSLSIPSLAPGGQVTSDGDGNLSATVPSPSQGSNLVSGCIVFYSTTALTAMVPPCTYIIAGTKYSFSTSQTVTFLSNVSGDSRIDVVYVDNTGAAGVQQGVPAVNPAVPSIDPTTQISAGSILITNGATHPGVTNELVYNEDAGSPTEWNCTSSGGSIVMNSTANPFNGSINVQGTAVAAGAYFQCVRGAGTVNITGQVFDWELGPGATKWAKQKGLTVAAYAGSTVVGTPVTINNGAFAFNTGTNAYQQIAIAGNAFGTGGTPIDTLRWTVTGGGASIPSFSFDYFNVQSGATTPPPVTQPPVIHSIAIPLGATNAASALTDADIGPQLGLFQLPEAGTMYEIDVASDAGTPNVIPQWNYNGSATALLSSALAAAALPGKCSNTGGAVGVDGLTTCSSTLENVKIPKGAWLGLTSGTAGGVAKQMTVTFKWTTP